MIPGEKLVDAFIDANILFVIAFVLWSLTRSVLRALGIRHAHSTELKLLNGVFLAIVFSPFLIAAHGALKGAGFGVGVNFSDMVVAHYLNGGFAMPAEEFERLLFLRETVTGNVMEAAGWGTWAVIAAFTAGFALGLVRLVHSVWCLRRIVASSYAWRSHGRVRIRLSERTLVPFSTRGLRNFYVVIPSHMIPDRSALRVSLAHEFQHLRQGDIGWEILLEAMKPVFFLNPVFHAWKRQVEALRELSCDSEVMTRGRIDMGEYCDTLLSVCQKTLRRDRTFVSAVPKVTLVTADRGRGGSFLERRLMSLLERGRLRYPRLVLGAMLAPLVAVILFTAVAIQSPGDWSHDRLMLSTVVNLERLRR